MDYYHYPVQNQNLLKHHIHNNWNPFLFRVTRRTTYLHIFINEYEAVGDIVISKMYDAAADPRPHPLLGIVKYFLLFTLVVLDASEWRRTKQRVLYNNNHTIFSISTIAGIYTSVPKSRVKIELDNAAASRTCIAL